MDVFQSRPDIGCSHICPLTPSHMEDGCLSDDDCPGFRSGFDGHGMRICCDTLREVLLSLCELSAEQVNAMDVSAHCFATGCWEGRGDEVPMSSRSSKRSKSKSSKAKKGSKDLPALTPETARAVATLITITTVVAIASVTITTAVDVLSLAPSSPSAETIGSKPTAKGASYVLPLILQSQFLALIGLSSARHMSWDKFWDDPLVILSSDLQWLNYRFTAVFEQSTSVTYDRRLLDTLLWCVLILMLVSLLRLMSNKLMKHRMARSMQGQEGDVRMTPFPKWELAVCVTQVQGLSIVCSSGMLYGNLTDLLLGILIYMVVFAGWLMLVWLARLGARGKVTWESVSLQEAVNKWKEDTKSLARDKRTTLRVFTVPVILGRWLVHPRDCATHVESWLYMNRFGILIQALKQKTWWYYVYCIWLKLFYPWLLMLPMVFLMGFTIIELLLVLFSVPHIDLREWIAQVLAVSGNVGITMSLFLYEIDFISEETLHENLMALILVSFVPLAFLSLCSDANRIVITINQIRTPSRAVVPEITCDSKSALSTTVEVVKQGWKMQPVESVEVQNGSCDGKDAEDEDTREDVGGFLQCCLLTQMTLTRACRNRRDQISL